MNGRIWKASILLAVALATAAFGVGSASVPPQEIVVMETTPTTTVDLDADIAALFDELGGTTNPDSQACCSANCIISTCSACCNAPSIPSCACKLGSAECRCVAPPPAVQALYQQVMEAIGGGGSG